MDQGVKQEGGVDGQPLFVWAVSAQLDEGPGGGQVYDRPALDATVFLPLAVAVRDRGFKRYRGLLSLEQASLIGDRDNQMVGATGRPRPPESIGEQKKR